MGFITKRLGTSIVTLFLVSALSFAAFRLIPGDAALLSLGTEATEAQIASLRAEMGLDRSFLQQYISWLTKFFTGNLGNSARFRGESVSALILRRLPVSFGLAGLSFIFIILIAFPLSLFTAKKENSFIDRIVNTVTAMGLSTPGFFMGVLFIWIFGVLFRFFVPGAYVGYEENASAFFAYLVFPALAIALPNSALLVKFLRSSIFREFRSDYVRTARSKGAGRSRILRLHVLKNACIPAITLLGMISGEIFSGSIIIEQVFSIPGIGMLLIASITARDYPMIGTLIVYIAFVVILANTLADLAIQIIDPRIRLSQAEKAGA